MRVGMRVASVVEKMEKKQKREEWTMYESKEERTKGTRKDRCEATTTSNQISSYAQPIGRDTMSHPRHP